MAHADYNCCAICDSKLEYAAYDAETKKRICEYCLKQLRSSNLNILTVDELIEWVNTTDKETIYKVLSPIPFRFCFYVGAIDEVLINKGFKRTGEYGEKLKLE